MNKTVKLGDLCKPAKGQIKLSPDTLIDYIDISSVDSGSKRITGFQTMAFSESPSRARKSVSRNNIIVSTVRPNLNAVAVYEDETPNTPVVSTGFCVLECNDNVDYRYIFNYCRSTAFIDSMVSQATGASYPAVTDKIIRSALIPEHSYEEQLEISNTLDKVALIIEKRKAEISTLDELIKARFVEMFGDIGTGKYRYETRKLGDVAYVGSSHRVFTNEFVSEGIPFYRGTEIGELANGQKPSDPFFISEEHYQRLASDETKPKQGDLLMPSICNKGQVWMVDTDEPFYYKDGRVLSISADRSIYNMKYLQFFMKEKTMVEYPKMGSGSTFAEFKIFLLRDMDILTPPRRMQEEFSAFVKQVDKSKVAIQKSLKETQLLFDSLMQDYFG